MGSTIWKNVSKSGARLKVTQQPRNGNRNVISLLSDVAVLLRLLYLEAKQWDAAGYSYGLRCALACVEVNAFCILCSVKIRFISTK